MKRSWRRDAITSSAILGYEKPGGSFSLHCPAALVRCQRCDQSHLPRCPIVVATGLLVMLACSARTATAQFESIREWTNRNGGSYTAISNWNPFSVPTADQAAIFPIDATYTVSVPSNTTTGEVLVSNGEVTFDLRPGDTSRTLTVPSTLNVGGEQDATMIIADGTVFAGDVIVRDNGLLEFKHGSGLKSVLNVSGDVDINGGRYSRFGSDELNLAVGSNVTVRNGGSFTTSQHHIHQLSTFNVSSGGTLDVTELQIASDGATGNGTLLVDGPGSSVTSGFASTTHDWGVGGRAASVEVRDGAILEVDGHLHLAADGTGSMAEITVDGAGSQFLFPDVAAKLVIGHATSGSAIFNVTGGALFQHVGGAGGSSVLINATGQVNVADGGVFEAQRILFDGGQLNISGGTLRIGTYEGNLVNPDGRLEAKS